MDFNRFDVAGQFSETGGEEAGSGAHLEHALAAFEADRDVVDGVQRGALVGRLSMGMPAANGNFSGVVKNSFLIEGGRVGAALSEVMVSGNMAQMLRDVLAVSAERLDCGDTVLPWLRIGGLHFS